MRIPKGNGFDLSGGLIITVVLEGGFSLTGRFLGEFEDRHHDHHDEGPRELQVEVENEFILLQLTAPFSETELASFPVGSIVAVNVAQILFIGAGGDPECLDEA